MPIMTDKRDEAKGPAPLDSDAAQAEPAGAQAVPSGEASDKDALLRALVSIAALLGQLPKDSPQDVHDAYGIASAAIEAEAK